MFILEVNVAGGSGVDPVAQIVELKKLLLQQEERSTATGATAGTQTKEQLMDQIIALRKVVTENDENEQDKETKKNARPSQ